MLEAYAQAPEIVQVKVTVDFLKRIWPNLKKEQLTPCKALYCRSLLKADKSDLGTQDFLFKVMLENGDSLITDAQWANIYDQIDQHFRELISDYEPIEAFQ